MQLFYLLKNEWMLSFMMVVLLILKVADNGRSHSSWIRIFNGLMLVLCVAGWLMPTVEGEAFGGMFFSYKAGAFAKNLLCTGTLFIGLIGEDWLKKTRHVVEFYLLIISTLMGMCFMISAGHMLMFYLSLELASIPLAAMCNFGFEERRSGEAAMKLILSSAFSSGLMLMGISFLYGATGTLSFAQLTLMSSYEPLFIIGFVLLFTGIVFKLSVVPFHLWTADVYEGSPAPVTAFLSVISKGAMVMVFAYILYHVFGALNDVWYTLLYVLSIATMVIGNLFAIRQQNLKRFLAFSSITQIGYILVGISGSSAEGFTAAMYFIVVYLFSNIVAFGVITHIASKTGNETIDSYKGLAKTNPFLAWSMAIALFSLAGVPPTAGFFGKIFLLKAGVGTGNFVLIIVAALNMIVALYYYLRVIRAMFMDSNENAIQPLESGLSLRIALFVCLAGIILTGFAGSIYEYILNLNVGL
ncbi:MAG: NADH-quinone oxidoreductase subunit N [Bacteroidetes bacterium]|nr:NADH-quinone oxidoreductase subunit N [Bacteroidota bacterium]